MEVLVTGATGRTGKLVLKKLLERADEFKASALVRSEKKGKELVSMGLPREKLHYSDIVKPSADLSQAFAGKEAVIITTSAVPKVNWWGIPKFLADKAMGVEGAHPPFSYSQWPEAVDWEGQKHQIDAAKEAGVKKVVLVSSMGGKDVNHFLNRAGGGNILLWKRKAEMYLIASGMKYTILHPGGLTDAKEGEKPLLMAVDDALLKHKPRTVPRGDVAQLCVQSLVVPETDNRSVDVIAAPEAGEATASPEAVKALFATAADCDYSAPDVDAALSK